MFTIHLNNLRFHGRHGVHAEETIVGNNFELSVSVSFEEEGEIQGLPDTVNYVELHRIIKNRFEKPVKLLETLAQDICNEIKNFDGRIKRINISINKLNPPIPNFTGTVGVSVTMDY